MVTRSKKAFKTSTHSETYRHQSQIIKIVLTSEKHEKSVTKSKEFEKNAVVLGDIFKTREIGLAFYYISRC